MDVLERLEKDILTRKIKSPEQLDSIKRECIQLIESGAEIAIKEEQSDPEDVMKHIYSIR